jgi:hypothetical protein
MPESDSTDSRQYPQVRGARFAERAGRFTGMPRMTLRLYLSHWKLRALCWVLRRLRAGQRGAGAGQPGRMLGRGGPARRCACPNERRGGWRGRGGAFLNGGSHWFACDWVSMAGARILALWITHPRLE